MLTTTADILVKTLKDEHKRLNQNITINGETFTRKELMEVLKTEVWYYRQSKYEYSLVRKQGSCGPELDKYYRNDKSIDWDRWNIDRQNMMDMESETWVKQQLSGAMIGDKFYSTFELRDTIKQALKAKIETVSVLDVTVPYKHFIELCEIWNGEEIKITNGTTTQIKFEVPKYKNVSTILAKTVEDGDLVIKIS